jgi:hypothetical protein
MLEARQIKVTKGFGRKVLTTLAIRTPWTRYPDIWKAAAKAFSYKYDKCTTSGAGSKFVTAGILEFMYNFYKNIKLAMPPLLGYRFQNQIMMQYTNKNGKSVIDYEDDENSVVVKTLPIMDATKLFDTFRNSFGAGG